MCASRRKRVVGGRAAGVVGAQEGHLVRLAQLGHVGGAGEPRGAQRHRLSVHRPGVRQVSEMHSLSNAVYFTPVCLLAVCAKCSGGFALHILNSMRVCAYTRLCAAGELTAE